MHMNNKIKFYFINIIFVISAILIGQNAELITQKINVENAIRDKVSVMITKLVDRDNFVIIVNARMDQKPSFQMNSATNMSETPNNDSRKNGAGYSPVPGLLPTMPKQTIYEPEKSSAFSYSTEKYLLYGLDIAIYLDQDIVTGGLQQNIKRLILETLPEIVDCDDCLRFETMQIKNSKETGTYQEMLDKIAQLEEDRRQAEQQIMNWKFDQLEEQLAIADDARSQWEEQARQREKSRQIADSLRLAKLQKIETEYRRRQDSLYLTTSLKLDDAIRGRIQSEEDLNNKLIEIIKSGINNNVNEDVVKSESKDYNNIDLDRNLKSSGNMMLWIVVSIIILLLIVLLIVVLKNQRQKPIYLKPKENDDAEKSTPALEVPVAVQNQTLANENTDVQRSELNSLRQSAVSMSVGQKEGATQIVKDWLDDGEGSSETDEKETE